MNKKGNFPPDVNRLSEELQSMDHRQDRMFDDLIEVKKILKTHSLKFDKIEQTLEDILRTVDKIAGSFNNHSTEHQLLAQGHKEVLEFGTRLEKIEKIHPQGAHAT